jgi:hypothetical protein
MVYSTVLKWTAVLLLYFLLVTISSFRCLVLCPVAGGYLSFKHNIPKSLLLDGPHTVESHFALVNYQVFSSIYIFDKLPAVFILLIFIFYNLINCLKISAETNKNCTCNRVFVKTDTGR